MSSVPQQLRIDDFQYDLPEDRIARFPLEERDASRLLVWKEGNIHENIYRNIADELPKNAVLYFNETKVIRARLFFFNRNGGRIEVFCLDPAEGKDVALAMAASGCVRWNCMIGGLSKWKEEELQLHSEGLELRVKRIASGTDSHMVELNWAPAHYSFAEVLDKIGSLPIPPYLKRDTEEIDLDRYQTVYARSEGSVAAPTAGLHFTQRVFDALANNGISTRYVTLHVGAGTFKPVKSETMADHSMHAETIDVSRERIAELAGEIQGTVVAVGTTTIRTLESLYWLGVKVSQNSGIQPSELELGQWECYDTDNKEKSRKDAFSALENWMKEHDLDRLVCSTAIMIAPGYRFRVVGALVTNFHQPGSTLILLVAAITGNRWREIYRYALENNFRFLSYGDGSLLYF